MGINPLLPVLFVLQSVLTTNGRTVASSLYNVADSRVLDSSAQIMPMDIIFIYYLNYLKGNDKKALIRIYRRFVSVSKQLYKLTLQSHCTSQGQATLLHLKYRNGESFFCVRNLYLIWFSIPVITLGEPFNCY